MTRITIQLTMPEPDTSREQARPNQIEKIREALELIESGHQSRREWAYLKAIWRKLLTLAQHGKLGERGWDAAALIYPCMERYAIEHGVERDSEIESKLRERVGRRYDRINGEDS